MSARKAEAGDAVVGRNIRVHRLARRMSQSALARQIGISFQQLQKYESGANRVGAARLVRVAEALGVPVTALLEGVEQNKRRAASPLALIAHRHPLRLVEALAAIGDRRVRLALIAVAEGIARAGPSPRLGGARERKRLTPQTSPPPGSGSPFRP